MSFLNGQNYFLAYFMGSKATCTVFCSTFLSLGCLKSRTFRCMSASRESKSKGNLTRIRGTEYLIRMVDPSGLTKLTGYIRVNTLRLILVTAARLALSCRLCSAKGNALKYSKSCMQLLKTLKSSNCDYQLRNNCLWML